MDANKKNTIIFVWFCLKSRSNMFFSHISLILFIFFIFFFNIWLDRLLSSQLNDQITLRFLFFRCCFVLEQILNIWQQTSNLTCATKKLMFSFPLCSSQCYVTWEKESREGEDEREREIVIETSLTRGCIYNSCVPNFHINSIKLILISKLAFTFDTFGAKLE